MVDPPSTFVAPSWFAVPMTTSRMHRSGRWRTANSEQHFVRDQFTVAEEDCPVRR
ncbi:hypothetical protein [Streptomyces xanthophaeus]|uniref:hypothetical protein n=1 Tax=Streptomyces xanthophaeus TaxID=67385 RepID=UPI0026470740|nr:hypothetical protein [Streptomyces xanthophaeus]WKD37680.1 hypothetical protein KO717_03150 [Streptomyces xanthophaeus]